MDYQTLKNKHRDKRDNQEASLSMRIHRALSWLNKAEQEEDTDAKFIFLWICFNAVYASDLARDLTERGSFLNFLNKLVDADKDQKIHGLLFKEFSGLIRVLISNKYIFEPFWRAVREQDQSNLWESQFQRSIQSATKAVMTQETDKVLEVIFDRLYVLRNQLMHGGATWQSDLNRQQVIDGTAILEKLLPIILDLMIDQTEFEIGDILYPVI